MSDQVPTRDELARRGKRLVSHINHEEYELGGVVYVAGWRSKEHIDSPYAAGWVVYPKESNA